jgi:bifunctional oligoribonuclease and PAP phosphatase NrnA
MYCGVEMPTYLRYMSGWDRVHKDLPHQFDLSVIVDASTMTLLEKLSESGQQGWVASKPCIILDHHEVVENVVPFATVTINDYKCSSTGELIYKISKQLGWQMNKTAQEMIMSSILGDTQGLTNQLATSTTYRIIADMLEGGIDRARLEETRREYSKMHQTILKYKGQLIDRVEFAHDGQIAYVTVPQNEINTYSPLYNPAPLIQGDMLQTEGVKVAIVFKKYDDGKVTGAIRCNPSAPVGAELAEHFGGGGHNFASGFKIDKADDFDKLKHDCIARAEELLSKTE